MRQSHNYAVHSRAAFVLVWCGTLYVTLQGDDTGRVLTVVALHAAERMGHLRAPSSPAV